MEIKLYTPQDNELQFTFRAIITGCLIGGVVSAMNIYFGLRTGWGFGGSIIAAILSYSIFQVLRPKTPFGVLETNIAQTAGSAAGSMSSAAGLVSAIPAMSMLGYKLELWELFIWALSIAYLGVFFAIPLRKQMVIVENLRFPTGTATAETIVAVFAKGNEAMRKSKALLIMAVLAGAHTLLAYFFPALGHPTIIKMIGLGAISTWGFSVLISPMMFGAGILIGNRVGFSLLAGAILAWGILGPFAAESGWVSDKIMDYKTGPRGWILWPGVALMVTDALMSLVMSYKSIINTFKRVDTSHVKENPEHKIPNKFIFGGLLLACAMTCIFAKLLFDISPILTILAIFMSAILSMIATRSTGETDINPIGGMGKVTQMIYGVVSPGNMSTNLMAAAITGSGASQAADMMQDLKTGHMLGANPFKQFKAQCIGIFFGILFAIPIYKLFDSAYTIGEGDIPAPAAHAWKAMAQVLSQGTQALPEKSLEAVIGAIVLGVVLALLKKVESIKKFLPSGLAMGIAFIVPAYYSLAMFFGTVLAMLWRRLNPDHAHALGFAVASGLVAGEGLMGIVTAALTLLGIK
jgi:putative OPT family oligopeptide transporter